MGSVGQRDSISYQRAGDKLITTRNYCIVFMLERRSHFRVKLAS